MRFQVASGPTESHKWFLVRSPTSSAYLDHRFRWKRCWCWEGGMTTKPKCFLNRHWLHPRSICEDRVYSLAFGSFGLTCGETTRRHFYSCSKHVTEWSNNVWRGVMKECTDCTVNTIWHHDGTCRQADSASCHWKDGKHWTSSLYINRTTSRHVEPQYASLYTRLPSPRVWNVIPLNIILLGRIYSLKCV